jgi:putative ABC transport system permease protein
MTFAGTRQAVATLLRKPFTTALAVLTLGAGISASTATFILVHAAIVAPIPFDRPDQLIAEQTVSNKGYDISISVPNYNDLSTRNRVYARSGAAAGWRVTLSGRGPARAIEGQAILGDLFETLGMKTERGRIFTGRETLRGGQPHVVISHAFYAELGGNPSLIGSTITLDQNPYTIIGVLPPAVGYPSPTTSVYLPLCALGPGLPWDKRDSSFGLDMVSRLRPGASLASAQRDLNRIAREIDVAEGHHVIDVRLQPLADSMVGDLRRPVLLLFAAGGLVVLLATINVASLLLARAEGRRNELMVRQALGAPRLEILRLLLTESTFLALFGGALGLLGGSAIVRFVAHRLGDDLPYFVTDRLRLSLPAIGFSAALALLLALIVGALPAWSLRTATFESGTTLRTTANRQRGRFRSGLVIVQLALGVVLLVGSGLLLSTVHHLRTIPKGFEADDVIAGRIVIPDHHFKDKAAWLGFFRRLLSATESSQGVRAASLSLLLPLSHRSWELELYAEGMPLIPDKGDSVLYNIVTPSYFPTLEVPLLAGRLFSAQDRDGTEPVAIVDDSLARRYWPGQSALGKKVVFDFDAPEDKVATKSLGTPHWRTIVGIVRNVHHYELQTPSRIQVYVPLEQTIKRYGMGLEIAIRAAPGAAASLPHLSRLVADTDSEVAVTGIHPLSVNVSRAMVEPILVSSSVTSFGSLAVLLAAVGVFALASFTVAERRREWAIRQAVGATPGSILGSVLRHGASWCLWGTAAGVTAAWAAARFARSLLFEVRPLDFTSYAAALAVLVTTVAVACLIPAYHATRIQPHEALREE